MSRPGWDDYFLEIAEAVSRRADCTRRRVGAVIVREHRIVATGYNGAPAGQPGCLTASACPRGRLSAAEMPAYSSYDNCTALHAEVNAVVYAGREACLGAVLYVTCEPCQWCRKVIAAAGITRIVFPAYLLTACQPEH